MAAVPVAVARRPTWTMRRRGQVGLALDGGAANDNRRGMPTTLNALARSSAVHVAFAVLAMGGWAVFANRQAGIAHALTAGAVQGALSGAITFGLKRFLEAAAARLPGVWAAVAPPATSCVVILILLIGAHRLAGTRHIWATISLPYAVSSTYAWVYALMMKREHQAAAI
jgi:hypothetical protein